MWLPGGWFPQQLRIGNLERVRKLIRQIALGLHLKPAVRQQFQFGIVTAKGKKRPDALGRPKHLRGANRRCQVCVTGYEYDGIARINGEQLHQLYGDRNIRFLFLMVHMNLLTSLAPHFLLLEAMKLHLHAGCSERPHVDLVTRRLVWKPVHERGEVEDLLKRGPVAAASEGLLLLRVHGLASRQGGASRDLREGAPSNLRGGAASSLQAEGSVVQDL